MACGVTGNAALLDQAGFCQNGAKAALRCVKHHSVRDTIAVLLNNHGIVHEGKWGMEAELH